MAFHRDGLDGAAHAAARIVDQDIQASETLLDVGDHALPIVFDGDVEFVEMALALACLDLPHSLSPALLVAPRRNDVSAGERERERHTFTDAGRRTGDEGDLARKVREAAGFLGGCVLEAHSGIPPFSTGKTTPVK